MSTSLRWDAPELQVESDTAWRARYRALQSWYRETQLKLAPGLGGDHRLVGSMVDAAALAARPDANFDFAPGVLAYVNKRVGEVRDAGGTLEEDRLRRNLLSSMPLAFNLFGYLRRLPDVAAAVFGKLLHLDIARIDRLEVEWAPPPADHLGDRTAFDAFVEYRLSDGSRAFLGVETKYTEPFSTTEYNDRPAYRALTDDPRNGFKPDAMDALVGAATNQLWRNALLALSLRKKGRYAAGHVLVLSCRGDPGAKAALEGLRAQHRAPETLIRALSFEELIAEFKRHPETRTWAEGFDRRYLDLSPVTSGG